MIDSSKAEYIKGAVFPKDYPEWERSEIVLLGRSNVGKSTFINRFCSRKKLAYTSAKPGKTQVLNFFILNDEISFVDVPGYGYAKVSKKQREEFGKMIETFLTERTNLACAVLLVDFKVGPTEDDLLMYRFLKHFDIPVIVIATKKDKVKNSMWHKQQQTILTTLKLEAEDSFYAYSFENNKDMEKIHDLIEEKLKKESVD